MKGLIVLISLVLAFSSFAFAADQKNNDLLLKCKPVAQQPNGLNIKSLVLDISSEDPEATMTIRFEGKKATVRNMSYTGTDTYYKLIPNGENDGDVSVNLKLTNGKWKATVLKEGLDTFSILDCK